MASVDAEKTEAKQEGVIEAASELAQDPQSHVNPETVEEKLVEETREAGMPAFQFDPDASPEDKAAAAEAVRVSQVPRERGRQLPNCVLTNLVLASAAWFPPREKAQGHFGNHG